MTASEQHQHRTGGPQATTFAAAPMHEEDVLLRDGRIACIREVRDTDRDDLVAMHHQLTDRSRYLRFFSLDRNSADGFVDTLLCAARAGEAVALLATVHGLPVGLGSYQRDGEATAEVSFAITDEMQGQGLATMLLERLADSAKRRGIQQFSASVLAENAAMVNVLRMSGFVVETTRDHESIDVRFPVRLTENVMEAITARERATDALSMRALFTPRSVAVIGASRREHSPGNAVLRNLLDGDFAGSVYAVNPAADEVLGLPSYDSVLDIPGVVDLAVVAVPAGHVLSVTEDCVRAHVRNMVILSAGFAESGPVGRKLQDAVVRTARAGDMRVVGPNCLGIANTDPTVRLSATFADTALLPGTVGLMTQSGAVGIAALQRAHELGIGLSTFVSAGNKADVSGNDLLMYWDDDERTRVVALYLESFGNPAKFSRLARHVADHKPVVALVGGSTPAGGRAATGHTSAAVTSSAAVDALFDQCGVMRVGSLEQLLHVTSLVAHQPLPAGNRVAIVSNGGGPGVLAADACATGGLAMADLAPATSRAISRSVPGVASTGNPVDLGAGAGADAFAQALQAVSRDPGVDIVVAIHTPVPGLGDVEFTAAVGSVADHMAGKTTIAVMLGRRSQHPIAGPVARIPVFAFPEDAARTLAPVLKYVAWRDAPRGSLPELAGVDHKAARSVVSDALSARPEGCRLDAAGAQALLGAYGIRTVDTRVAHDAASAVSTAERLGYPVVMKYGDPEVVHKTDTAGVRLGLADDVAVRDAYRHLTSGNRPDVLVQHQAEPGLELIVGMTQDEVFGPVVMFGIGGTATDLIADRTVRLAPLTTTDAESALHALRSSPLLFGYRGAPAVDGAVLEDLLLRVGRIADDLPQVAEIDLNPVIASPGGLAIVDAKVRLRPHVGQAHPLLPRLHAVAAAEGGHRR